MHGSIRSMAFFSPSRKMGGMIFRIPITRYKSRGTVEKPIQKPLKNVSNTFAAFRHYNYRLWFFGQLISMIGTWMQSIAQGFLIYSITGSPAFLGYVGFVSGIPSWLFMVYGGVVADRVPRRTLMIITQSFMMILAFILAGLVFSNVVLPWHILVLSFLLGTANAFDTPARQAIVLELVNREDMTNAIAFNATMFNTGAIVGPAIGGVIYALTGPGWCFIINGVSFIAVICALALMRIQPVPAPAKRPSAMSSILEGFQYVRSNRLVLTLSISVFIYNIFGWGLITLLPAWAVHVLGGDVTTNGLLLSARGMGAVIGGLLLAVLANRGFRGKMWSVSSFVIPILMIGFALTRFLPASLTLLGLMGFTLFMIMNNSNTIVQSYVPDALRGRVMAIYSLMFMGGGPLGALFAGTIASQTNEQITAIICASALAVYAACIWFFRPDVRAMQ
jgi:MFS family permease